MKTEYLEIEAFKTKDGSLIRELMHPDKHDCQRQSLAHASIPPGCQTMLHKHHLSEELYHITGGTGEMTLAESLVIVKPGDTICIPPGTPHCIRNTGKQQLQLLCCCSPAYSDEDSELL